MSVVSSRLRVYRKKVFAEIRAKAIFIVLSGCLLLAAPLAAQPATQSGGSTIAQSPSAEMDGLLTKAVEAIESNHLAEAIHSLVSVIAVYEAKPEASIRPKAEKAASELAKIGSRLSIEPSNEWVDSKGSQIAAASRGLGKSTSLSPSVYLFENFGQGKSPVPDAPIYFEFIKNSGSIISFVNTDAYGKANTTLARLDAPGKEALIRAYPVFKARDKSYAFKSVFREFSYLPPVAAARVIVLETGEFGSVENPQTGDAVASALKPLGLALSTFNGKLAPESFKLAFGGDSTALAAVGMDAQTPYAALILVECQNAKQMELNGKKYNIFTAAAKVTFRLIRSDGSIVFTLPLGGSLRGQGNSAENAASDGFKRAREALVPELEKNLPIIKAALEKE